MSVSIENTSALGRKLDAAIPNQTFQNLLNTKITKLSKEIKLKGFRPGKVPVQVVKKQFGASIRQEVITELVDETIKEAIAEQNIKLAGQPVLEKIEDNDDQDLKFTITFEIFPKVELADISETEITKKVVEVTEADVEKMQYKLCRNLGKWEDSEKAAQEGSQLVIDFVRTVEGDEAEPVRKDVKIELEEKLELPELKDKLMGSKAGDTLQVEVTYPETWGEEKIAGKKAQLEITVQKVLENQPLTTEEVAQRLGLDVNKPEELAEKIKERMEEEANRSLFQELQENVLEILLEKNTFDLPEALIQQEKNAIYKERERNKASTQPSESEQAEIDDAAIKRVKLGLLVNEIIAKYNLKADGSLLRKEVEYMAREFPNPEEIINIYFSNERLLSNVERIVLLQQSVDSLTKDMKTKEQKVSFDEVMNPKQNKG